MKKDERLVKNEFLSNYEISTGNAMITISSMFVSCKGFMPRPVDSFHLTSTFLRNIRVLSQLNHDGISNYPKGNYELT